MHKEGEDVHSQIQNVTTFSSQDEKTHFYFFFFLSHL